MNIIALKEKAEGILQKEVEDTSFEDVGPLMEYVAYLEHEIFMDKKFIRDVNRIFTRANNFQRLPDIPVDFLDKMDLFFGKVAYLNGEEPYYQAEGVDVYDVAKKISFINDFAINQGNLIRFEEKDGTFTGREYPLIHTGNTNLRGMSQEIWKAIREINALPRIFHFQGRMLRLLFVDGRPTIKHLSKYDLRHVLETVADYYKSSGPDYAKDYVCDHILSTPDPPVPVLERIVHAPHYDPDGTLIFMPGYSEKAHCFYHETCSISAPKNLKPLSNESISEAKRLILYEVLGDFPFVSKADKAHAVAMLLHPFVRSMIQGPTPIHVIDSPGAGTGKTLLAQSQSYIPTGQNIELQAAPSRDDEWRKRITSTLATYPPYFVVDNVTKKIDSGALSAAVTAPI
jgi:hypothetical protein